MSVTTVLRDDVRNTRRSFVVLGVIGVLTLLVGLIVGSDASAHDHAYRALFDVSFFFFLALPLILAPLTYLAVAGDRSSGSIKHALGLPNTRAEYLTAKYLSRGGVAVVGIAVALLVGFVVAISSMTARRSRAMFGVITAYFVLGPFWLGILPVVSLTTILDAVASTLGVTLSETTRGLVVSLSPSTAYLSATEIVYTGVIDQYESLARNFQGDRYYDRLWFNALVMALWGGVTMTVGYARFRTAELG